MKIAAFVAAVALTSLMSGCSSGSSSPSDADIESQVKAAVLSDGKANIATVENFKKTNGYVDATSKDYVAEVSYDFVFKKSEEEITKGWEKLPSDKIAPEVTFAVAFLSGHDAWKAGTHFPMTDKVPFHKTENGWQIDK